MRIFACRLKRMTATVIALMLAIPGAVFAQQKPMEDVNLVLEDDYIVSAAVLDDDIYLLTNKGLMEWNATQEEPELLNGNVSRWANQEPDSHFNNFDGSIQKIFASEKELWGLNAQQGVLCTIEDKGDTWEAVPQKSLLWDDMLYFSPGWDANIPRNITSVLLKDNLLVLLVSKEDVTKNDVIFFDIETGEQKTSYITDIYGIAFNQEGDLLALQYDGIYFGYGEPSRAAQLGKISLTDDQFIPIAQLPWNKAYGFTYNENTQSVCMIGEGELHGWNLEEGFVWKNYIPVHSSSYGAGQGMSGIDFYAVFVDEKIYVRTFLSIDEKTTEALVISGANQWEGHVKAFQDKMTQVPLKLVEDVTYNAVGLGQQMLTGDDSIDIFLLDATYSEYASLVEKGYVTDLSSSEILGKAVEEMNPKIKDAVIKDGKLVALPISLHVYTMGYMNHAFETLGLEMPVTWVELMDFYANWAEELSTEYSNYSLFSMSRFFEKGDMIRFVFNEILTSYVNDLLLKGEPLRFETETFANLLTELDKHKSSFDLLIEEGDPTQMTSITVDVEKYLMNSYANLVPEENNIFDNTLLPPQLVSGEKPMAGAYLSMLVINPNSKNKELAMTYLETAAQNFTHGDKIAFYPNYNEPLADPYVVQYITDLEAEISEHKLSLETATEEEKQLLQNKIEDKENEMENTKDSRKYWLISPKRIEEYRNFEDQWGIIERHPLGSGNLELVSLLSVQMQDYINGGITKNELMKGMDQKIQMIEMEMQ